MRRETLVSLVRLFYWMCEKGSGSEMRPGMCKRVLVIDCVS